MNCLSFDDKAISKSSQGNSQARKIAGLNQTLPVSSSGNVRFIWFMAVYFLDFIYF